MKNLTTKLIGAAIGAGVGYFVGCVIADIIWLKENQDDFEYEDLDEDTGNDDDTNLEPKEPAVFMGHNKNAKPIGRVKNYTEYFNSQGKPELAALAARYETGLPLTPDEEVNAAIDQEHEVSMHELDEDPDIPPEIQVISMEEYANAEGFAAITLKYYEDDVVTDEHDTPIDRPEDILGDDALVSFGELSGDEDVVYVRNLPKRTVYEVIRTNKEYAAPVRSPRRHKKEEENAEEDNT